MGPLDYSDTGAYWLRNYESETFQADIEGLWQTIKPFYQQLHAYVRAKLRAHYGEDKIPKNQPIPAHLLGNMWAQSWGNIEDLVLPYPGKTSIDVTPEMLKQVSCNQIRVKSNKSILIVVAVDLGLLYEENV